MDAIPEITDGFGYILSSSDINLLGLSEEDVWNTARRISPLAMTPPQYVEFVSSLLQALVLEGIRYADVRVQGSSVKFFSNATKSMPYEIEEIYNTFLDVNKCEPTKEHLNAICAKIKTHWPVSENRPRLRPFDAFYALSITDEPSDYDIQISSNGPYRTIEQMLSDKGLDPGKIRVNNPNYQFMRKEYSDKYFVFLQEWASRWWNELDRPVNIALFENGGPREVKEDGKLSSHFRDDDWIVFRGAVQYKKEAQPDGR